MPTDDTNFEDELRALMAAGRKIEAIKQVPSGHRGWVGQRRECS